MLLLFPSFYSISLFFSFSFFAYYFVSNLISKLQTKKITRNLLAGLLESPKIFNNVSPFYTWIIQWDPTTASWHDERRIANFVFFFFLLYVNSSEKKPSFSFYPNIHYYICWRVSTKQKQKQILPSLYDGNVLSRVLRLFFSSPLPFLFLSLFFFGYVRNTTCLLFSFGWCIEIAHLDDERLETTNEKYVRTIVWHEMKRKEIMNQLQIDRELTRFHGQMVAEFVSKGKLIPIFQQDCFIGG